MTMTSQTGTLVVLSGPSGAGKTSVVRALKEDSRVQFSVSATTRPQRSTERDGVDYHFFTADEFETRAQRGEFLEHAEYGGSRYGTLRQPMQDALEAGRHFVLEIEVQGTRQLRDAAVEGMYVFLVPPSLDELRRRLESRRENTAEDIERRLAIAASELEAESLYDHVVVNQDLDSAIAEVRALIGLESS